MPMLQYPFIFQSPKLRQGGMTLVEVLIALAILVVVMISVVAFEVGIFSNQQTVSSSLQTSQDAQVILRTMLTELRSAAPGMNGVYTLVTTGTSSIVFFSDTDNDGQTERVGYSLIGKTVYRTIVHPTGTPPAYVMSTQSTTSLVTNVRNSTSTPLFQYFDDNYTGTSSPLVQPVNPSIVSLIQINLTLDTDPNRSPLPRIYSTQVNLRNMKTNL